MAKPQDCLKALARENLDTKVLIMENVLTRFSLNFIHLILFIITFVSMLPAQHACSSDLLKIDDCLDKGGSWDSDKQICNLEEESVSGGGQRS